MTLEITLGWWLLPTIVTIAAFVWASKDDEANGLAGAILFLGATVVSLAAWVIYLGVGWALA